MGRAARTREKLDFGWMFHKGSIDLSASRSAGAVGELTDCVKYIDGEDLSGEIPQMTMRVEPIEHDLASQGWVQVDLPHDWLVEENYVHDPKLANGGYLPRDVGCYRKEFEVPASDEGRKIFIEFDGIFRDSTVWVNGTYVGNHPSGYTSFYYDITSLVRYGDEGKNVVFVRVDARRTEGWWYEGAGIYRHVRLTKTDPLRVVHWGTYVTTPEITQQAAKVSIRTTVQNDYAEAKECELVNRVVDAEGKTATSVSSTEMVQAYDKLEFAHMVTVENPRLWSIDSPYLYRVLTEVKTRNAVVDTYETTFGIRTSEFTSDRGFLLNGEQVLIKGTCNHQDFAGVGIALPDRINEYKLQLLKGMGSNAYRCAHHPPTPEVLDICDRIGMLVMDENRWLNDSPECIADLKSMLYRDRNHPCIILWSMENEERLQAIPKMGRRILRTLINITHKVDPTRPTTSANCHGWDNPQYRRILDVIGYNYGQVIGREVDGKMIGHDLYDHMMMPNHVSVGSETANNPVTRGVYQEDKEKGYCSPFVVYGPWFEWRAEAVEKTWKNVLDHPFLSGIFCWTGIDYRGEPGPIRRWPNMSAQYAPIDMAGFPKDKYYFYKSIWTDEPLVHIFPHWNWPGREGQEMEVWAFSNCDEVELLLNGESLGKQQMPHCSHLVWKVAYAPGELTAKAWKDGRLATTKTVETTNPPARIHLQPHLTSINADGCDVSVVRVSILDDKGRVVPTACDEVRFSLEGPGKILGVGNGDPSSQEADKANYRRAFNGYCLVLVQAGKEAGPLTLTATSADLLPATAVIDAR